jgi:hypothetical protein
MKSALGLITGICTAIAYAGAYAYAVRAGAGWLDAKDLFLIALPYNWTMLHTAGASNFSLEAPRELLFAALFDIALAYIAGAVVEALLRLIARAFGLFRARA